ncbi:DUF6882 domain-containing protein [Frigoribacterium salinisoli]
MTGETSLQTLVDGAAVLGTEQQAHVARLLGQRSWQFDALRSTLTFSAQGLEPIVARAHFVGSAAPGPATWLWAWQNLNGYPEATIELAGRVRQVGEQYGVDELTRAEIPLDPTLPERLVLAAAYLTGVYPYWSGPVAGGTRALLLMEHPRFVLPAPTRASALGAVGDALASGLVVDHRHAVASYARVRGVTTHEVTPDVLQLALADGPGWVRFDHLGRVVGLDG